MDMIEMIMNCCDPETMLSIGFTCKAAIRHYRSNRKAIFTERLERHLQRRPVLQTCATMCKTYSVSLYAKAKIRMFMGMHSNEWRFYKNSGLCWSYHQKLEDDRYESMYAGASGGGLCTGIIRWNVSSIMQHAFMCDCFPETRQIWSKTS